MMLDLPEDVAKGIEPQFGDLSRAVLESLVLEAYRAQALTTTELRRLLGVETRVHADAVLK